ncbi:cation transporter [Natronohydrobacter thiooxidans]|uniref:cation transporter n=1 Tax=Natronohydrobacter thiooxidans TaxID=87172 RepID=UPI0008FF0D06|nr:cation transporter [Natronohydrobacter thiooxidans]
MTERRALLIAFVLNASLAVIEIIAGLWARSVALLADAADFVEDSVIYLLALAMMGATEQAERRFGVVVAVLMMFPGGLAMWQALRFVFDTMPPEGIAIIAVSKLALAANLVSVAVILAARRGPQPESLGLRAAWLSSRNDALANIAMIVAGYLVLATQSGWPDLVVGLGVAVLHLSGGLVILRGALKKGRR